MLVPRAKGSSGVAEAATEGGGLFADFRLSFNFTGIFEFLGAGASFVSLKSISEETSVDESEFDELCKTANAGAENTRTALMEITIARMA